MASADTWAAAVAGLGAMVCAVIAVASWRYLLRSGNPGIRFVTAAFALLAAKGLAKALTLAAGVPERGWLELGFTVADTVAVALVAWPLLRRSPLA